MDFTGLAPLFLSVSDPQLQTISAVGAGLLIGTALGVILPEGSEAFRTAQHETSMSCLESQTYRCVAYIHTPQVCGQPPAAGVPSSDRHMQMQVVTRSYLTACLEQC